MATEEPDVGKLLVRFCEGRGWQLVRPLVRLGPSDPLQQLG